MSWREAESTVDTFRLSYERLFADVRQTLVEILEFFDLPVTADRVETAVVAASRANTRLNKGVSGRGQQLLTASHKAAIRELAAVWRIDLDEMQCLGLNTPFRLRLAA